MLGRHSLTEFHRKFGIISFRRTMSDPITVQTMSGRAYQYASNEVAIATLELPLDNFFELVKTTDEFEQLAQDPATCELIREARIIYKLRHGT